MSPLSNVARRSPAWCLTLAMLGCASGPPRAGEGEREGATHFDTDGVAHIVRVVDADTVVIGRGRRDGLVLPPKGAVMTVSPRPAPTDERPRPSVSFGIRSAIVSRVVAIGEQETTLDLAQIAAPIAVGDYVSWYTRAPEALRDDPVARCALLDVGMRTLEGEQLVELHALVAGGAEASRAAVDRMVAEVHAQAELAREVHTTPADGGRFLGLDLNGAFVRTTRDDVLAFLDFVATFPGRYLTWNWKFVEIYGTWVINRTPLGESLHLRRALEPLEAAARDAIGRRDFTGAAAAWRKVLALEPAHKRALAGIDQIGVVTRSEALLEHDPEQREAAWRRAVALGELGLHAESLTAWDALVAAGYRTRDAQKQRVYRLASLERWAEATETAEALLAAGEDAGLVTWRDYLRARAGLVAARGAADVELQAAAHLELARVHEDEKSWEAALGEYRRTLDLAPAPELRERAKAGQLRAARRQDLAEDESSALADIRSHTLSSARSKAWAVLAEYDSLGLPGEVARALVAFADAAGEVDERELQGALLARLVALSPGEADTWTRLGWHHVASGQWDEAEVAFEEAVKRRPLDPWARRSRAWLLAARGRYADAFAAAALSAKKDADLAHVLARAALARRDYAEAAEMATAAAALDPKRFGESARAVERLRAAAGKADPAAALTRVRALVSQSLPTLAMAELVHLERDPARRREAAWAIADASWILAPGDWALTAARIEGGSTPERQRRLAELEARAAFAREPSRATRRALAEALIARGAMHEALAIIGGGTTETDGPERRVDPTLQDLRARALRALDGVRLGEQAGEASGRGDHATAATLYGRARVELAWAGVPARAHQAALDEVRALAASGRKVEARRLGEAWLERVRADGNPFMPIDLEVALARLEASLDPDRAPVSIEALYDRHLATCLALEREHCEAFVRSLRADLAQERGRSADALAEAEAARRIWLGLRDAGSARGASLRLAGFRRQRGELADAMQLAEGAWREASEAGDAFNERVALLELGTTALRLGDAQAARRWLTAARVAGERGDDARTRGAASYWLGRVALDLEGDLATARVELERALGAFRALDEPVDVIAVSAMLARAAPERALELTAPLVAQARPLGRKGLIAEVLVARARALLAADRAREAQPLADEARALVATIDTPDLRARAFHLAGDLARAQDDPAATDHYVAAARAVAETLRRSGVGLPLGADTSRVIDLAIGGLYKEGRSAEAVDINDLHRFARAGRLIDLGRIHPTDRATAADLAELARARAEGEHARAQLQAQDDKPAAEQDAAARQQLAKVVAQSEQEIEALLMRLQRDNRELMGALAVSPVSLAQRRAELPRNVLVVDYFVAADALYTFVVRREDAQPQAVRVEVPRDRLTRTIARHRALLAQDGRLAEAVGRDLYEWLLAPLDKLVADADRDAMTVVVIAEGPLQYVPFAGLVASQRGAPLQYAVERWRLATALSTTIPRLFVPGPRARAKPSILALLDPTGELPGARDELVGLPNVTIYRGEQATLATFEREAARHPIVHVASHGRLDPDPIASGLGFADGTLTVDHVSRLTQLRNRTRLVVLSACQTATEIADAADAPDDEVISLARGFAIAGVPTVVASLWDVDDQATRRLMQAFYGALGGAREDTLESLRAAQRALIRDPATADPRFWAAFHLIGDWR